MHPPPGAQELPKAVSLAMLQAKLREAGDILDLEKKQNAETVPKEPGHVGSVLFYCGLNATLSASLIAFNKHLMHESRFPYPVPLVALHTTSSSIFVTLFFIVYRRYSNESAFFTALPQALVETSIKTKISILAALFAVQLVFSNAAYLYSSVVFIQMMKEGNIPFVYFLSVMLALEQVHWQRIRVLLVIVFATMLTIKGALHFTWTGFWIQLTGQCFEGTRIVFQALLLSANGLNIDVLTYMLLVMPACAVILLAGLTFNSCVLQVSAVAMPTSSVLLEWWPVLFANIILAVALNFTTALVVKHASAVGLLLSGLVKDSAIIFFGAYFLGEDMTSVQVCGFITQLLGIFIYSLIKIHPDAFTGGIYSGLKRFIGMEVHGDAALTIRDAQQSAYGASRT